jgi:hypothetical protein
MHVSRRIAFPEWAPGDVIEKAETLSEAEAKHALRALFTAELEKKKVLRRAKATPSPVRKKRP